MDNSDDPTASRLRRWEALVDVAVDIVSKQDSGTHEVDKSETTDGKKEERYARISEDRVPRKQRSHRRSHHQSSSSRTNTTIPPWTRLIEELRPKLQNSNAESKPSSCVTKSGLQSLEYKAKEDKSKKEPKAYSCTSTIEKMRNIPDEAWRKVLREKLESMNNDHTESPETTPEKPQTVDGVHVESSSRPLWDVDEKYDITRGLDLLSSVTVLIAEYEDKENKSKQDKPRAYSEPTNKEEEKFKEDVLNLWVRKFEQRPTTSVEPLQHTPNLDSVSTQSSSVSQSKKSRKKRKLVGGLEVEPTQTTLPEWLLNVMNREENSNNPKLISTLLKSDLDNQPGLLIPSDQVQNPDFLTEEETKTIEGKAMPVDFVGPQMNKHASILRKRRIIDECYHVFADRWNDVVATNSFKDDDVFHLWSFRYGREKLCFALVPPTTTDSSHDGGSTSGESGHGNTFPEDSGKSSHGGSSLGDDSPSV